MGKANRQEVDAVLEHFLINAGNPLNVITQDTAREFLGEADRKGPTSCDQIKSSQSMYTLMPVAQLSPYCSLSAHNHPALWRRPDWGRPPPQDVRLVRQGHTGGWATSVGS